MLGPSGISGGLKMQPPLVKVLPAQAEQTNVVPLLEHEVHPFPATTEH